MPTNEIDPAADRWLTLNRFSQQNVRTKPSLKDVQQQYYIKPE